MGLFGSTGGGGGFFSSLGDMFGNASLGDIGTLVGGVATAAAALKSPKDAPEASGFASPSPEKLKNVTEDVAEETAERRKRQRQKGRASRKVSFLGDSDIGAVSLNG